MKKLLVIATLFATFSAAHAQHELSINASGGYYPLSFSLSNNGATSGNIGGGAGIGYYYNISKTFSLGAGLDLSFYGASVKYSQLNDTYTGYDNYERADFEFTANLTNFKEDISLLLLEVPLTARYSLPLGATNSLRFIGGFKLGLPMSAHYTASADNLKTEGRYEYEGQTYQDIPGIFESERMGKHSGSWDAKMSMQLTAEVAYRFAIGEKFGLSVGVYFNYGLNDLKGKNDAHPIAFNPAGNALYTSNGVLDSNLASSVKPMAFGLRLRFDSGL
ncbi:MAG: outer membrane beta-barrel protein [Bacteroidales bacterium]|nr:outer membrane beta-barrel protein [Bacteroidales bacterium]